MGFPFYLKLYLLTIPIFFLIDIIWLGSLAKKFYGDNIGHLLSEKVNWKAALVFYFIYIVGILFYAVVPALEDGNWQKALLLGSAFGFFTYATYDLTNLATLKNWSVKVVVVDIVWGMILCGVVAAVSFQVAKWLL
ncbi:MAG: putative membrane protein [Granulosicoccus sp.]|jgi:uncharacterized membrane protein|tara:strand:- start:54 stop:461 length:408 start_codon:yes stop_codon:yes gene_type:complete